MPKRLRYFMQRDAVALNMVLRIFLRGIAQSLQAHCPGAAQVAKANEAALHIGAVAFIHRFGSSLNEHVHFHVCVVDEVFEGVAGEVDADAQATAPVCFLPRRTFVFTRPVESTRLSWPRCRPICAGASCAPSWAAA